MEMCQTFYSGKTNSENKQSGAPKQAHIMGIGFKIAFCDSFRNYKLKKNRYLYNNCLLLSSNSRNNKKASSRQVHQMPETSINRHFQQFSTIVKP